MDNTVSYRGSEMRVEKEEDTVFVTCDDFKVEVNLDQDQNDNYTAYVKEKEMSSENKEKLKGALQRTLDNHITFE